MGDIYISELLPNPAGKDTQGEFIELANAKDVAVSLTGWSLKDASGKTYVIESGSVPGRGFFVLWYPQTKISLNNDKETLELYDVSGNLQDALSYQQTLHDDETLIREGAFTSFLLTTTPTPGEKNKYQEPVVSKNEQEDVWGYGFSNEVSPSNTQQVLQKEERLSDTQNVLRTEDAPWEIWGSGVAIAIVLGVVFWFGYRAIYKRDFQRDHVLDREE